MNKPIVVITTAGSEPQALTIAEELIQSELAASVNIISNMRTIYRYHGKVFDDDETMLVIKTVSSQFHDIAELIKQLHTYEIPEIFSISATKWDHHFYKWLKTNSQSHKQTLQESVEEQGSKKTEDP